MTDIWEAGREVADYARGKNKIDEDGRDRTVTILLVAIREAAIRQYEERFSINEHSKQVAKLAKKLCQMDGCEPDVVTMYRPPVTPPTYGAKGTIAMLVPVQPQWVLYVDDAERALAAMDEVMGSLEPIDDLREELYAEVVRRRSVGC